ncbi:MAG: HNH endonuclease [Streptosporangiaceae bacterium]
MCDPGERPSAGSPGGPLPLPPVPPPDRVATPAPGSPTEAVALAEAGVGWVAGADPQEWTAAERADCLRGLERVEAALTAARARVLAAFSAAADFEDDGHGSPRTWLKYQTRITGAAASAAVATMRRLNAHPGIGDSLAAGSLSASWGRQIADWTDRLPEDARADADQILLAAAEGGADLRDLAALAEQIRNRTAAPDRDGDGFDDRRLHLATSLDGVGRLDGDLTPRCAAALRAVLDVLGKRAGPEDLRSKGQRDHDALEEACRRLIASGCLPDRAGQAVQLQLHISLNDLLSRSGAHSSERPGTQPDSQSGVRSGSQSGGRPDPGVAASSPGCAPASGSAPEPGEASASGQPAPGPGQCEPSAADDCCPAGSRPAWSCQSRPSPSRPWPARLWPTAAPGDECDAAIAPIVTGQVDNEILDRLAATWFAGSGTGPTTPHASPIAWETVRQNILGAAVALLSGPDGLAARLRSATLSGPAASPSLPLDLGAVTETIPPHLRRAVIVRDRHCAWPGGCDQQPAGCQVHHLIPRSEGGTTKLPNLVLLCSFHHLIAVHRWGWTLTMNSDGTYRAVSPDGRRVLRSTAPPPASAGPPPASAGPPPASAA